LERNSTSNHSFLDEDSETDVTESEIEKFILIDKLEKYIFSPGTIMWKRNFVLASPGDLLVHQYFEKFKKLTDRLPCEYILNPINISRFKDLFSDFKLATKFKTKNQQRIKLLKWFKSLYWEGEKKAVLAELMEAAHDVFYDLPETLDVKLKTSNSDLFRVYSLKASILVMLSLSVGIIDFKYLKDLYHLPFFFYIGLKEPLSFNHVEAFKYEWRADGMAIDYLEKNDVAQIEIDSFSENSKTSLNIYKAFYKAEENTNEVYNVFAKAHERFSGLGKPKGLNQYELSDIEILVVFVCENFGVEDTNPSVEDYGRKLGNRVLTHKSLPARIKNILQGVFEKLDEAEELLLGA
jgi:hypothetical protein